MKHNIPKKIRFLFEDTSGLIPYLIVFFIFRSKKKNSFTVGPIVTDKKGEIALSRQSVESVISMSKIESPMDYDGGLEDCDLLSVLVENRSELEDRVARLNAFYPDNASTLRTLLESATNDKAHLYQEIELPIEDEKIIVRVD